MKVRRRTLLALLFPAVFASTLEGASSRIALSGGPLVSSDRAASPIVLASPASIRPLQPGEMLVLGPIAGPVSELPPRAEVAVREAAPAASVATVDTFTVRAPAPVPETAPSPSRAGKTWEGYRSSNVVRIDLR